MTDDDKALVERLKRFSTRPIEHDAPAMNRVAMKEAADRIGAQAAEIEHLRAEAEAHYDRGYYDGGTYLLEQHEALREALAFYAREANYRSTSMHMSGQSGQTSVEIDGGKRAAEALAALGQSK